MMRERISFTWNDFVRIHNALKAVEGYCRQQGEALEAGQVQGLNSRFYALLQMTKEDSGVTYAMRLEKDTFEGEAVFFEEVDCARVLAALRSVEVALDKADRGLEAGHVGDVVEKMDRAKGFFRKHSKVKLACWPDGMPVRGWAT